MELSDSVIGYYRNDNVTPNDYQATANCYNQTAGCLLNITNLLLDEMSRNITERLLLPHSYEMFNGSSSTSAAAETTPGEKIVDYYLYVNLSRRSENPQIRRMDPDSPHQMVSRQVLDKVGTYLLAIYPTIPLTSTCPATKSKFRQINFNTTTCIRTRNEKVSILDSIIVRTTHFYVLV